MSSFGRGQPSIFVQEAYFFVARYVLVLAALVLKLPQGHRGQLLSDKSDLSRVPAIFQEKAAPERAFVAYVNLFHNSKRIRRSQRIK